MCNVDAGSQEAGAVSEFNNNEHGSDTKQEKHLTKKHKQYYLMNVNKIVLYKG